MKLICLDEFMQISGLTDNATLKLIKNHSSLLSLDKNKGLMLDIDKINEQNLIESIMTPEFKSLESRKELIKEKLSLIIADKLEELIDQTISEL